MQGDDPISQKTLPTFYDSQNDVFGDVAGVASSRGDDDVDAKLVVGPRQLDAAQLAGQGVPPHHAVRPLQRSGLLRDITGLWFGG